MSVVITSCNEASNIERCLQPLSEFGEVVLVDSFSNDDTVPIARRLGATVYQRPYRSAAAQKNWALDRIKNKWVLILDADEALTPGLLGELKTLDEASAADGYWVYRQSEYLGRAIKYCGWQRDRVLRLFRTDRGRYDDVHVHEEVDLQGSESSLTHKLVHFPYRHVEQHLEKIQEYSTRGARDYVDNGGRVPLLNMLVRPPFAFLRMYLVQGGFMDGRQGFVLCLLSSYSVFLKYAKAWELRKTPSAGQRNSLS